MFSAYADGLGQKQHSLTHQLKETNSTIFTIQETNHKSKGKYEMMNLKYLKSLERTKKGRNYVRSS